MSDQSATRKHLNVGESLDIETNAQCAAYTGYKHKCDFWHKAAYVYTGTHISSQIQHDQNESCGPAVRD